MAISITHLQSKIDNAHRQALQMQQAASMNIGHAGWLNENSVPQEYRPYKDIDNRGLYSHLAETMKVQGIGRYPDAALNYKIKEIELELQRRKKNDIVQKEDNMQLKAEIGQLYDYNDNIKKMVLECVNVSGLQPIFNVLASNDLISNPIGSQWYVPVREILDTHYQLVNKKENKMKEILKDVGSFVKEHRSVIYTVIFIALLDHLVLGGKFREKLKDLVEKALNKAHKSLEDKTGV